MADHQPSKTMIVQALIILATVTSTYTEYIPPGPRYPCPKDTQLLYPCVCEQGTDAGLYIKCENQGLAVLSVGIGNIAGLGFPIERLLLKECKFSHLFGPLFHRSTIRVLQIEDTPIQTIDPYTFAGVNRTLQHIYMKNTEIDQFPKDAFKILSNLTILSIDGHKMTKLTSDIFAGSEAAGRLEKLHLSNGRIADIPVEAFQNLKKLKTLDLHGNSLSTLKRNQFRGLRDTEVLDLSYNNIAKLDGSHIGDLTKLGWCNVSHNQIADLPRAMFSRNALLKVLHLDNNKLKKLDTNSFKGMRFLRRLFLQDNQISDVGRGTFTSVTRIGTIDLARNKITKVDYQMFQAVKYAEIINLAENKIKSIEAQAFTDLYLATVNISYNELTTIESGAFQNCNNMTLLDLSHNNLTDINKRAFDENSYAYEFDVSYNGFTNFGQIPIANMTGIRILNASYNEITIIPKAAFPKLYELHTVDVSHNALADIYNAVFQNLFSLRYLNLSHNSLETIKPATFGAIPTLLSVDLSHNKLGTVSRGSMAKLQSCRELNLAHNDLESLFQIPAALGELDVSHNQIKEIKANTWPQMNALLRLDLSANMLADISGDSFNLLTLQRLIKKKIGDQEEAYAQHELDVSHNRIKEIKANTWPQMNALLRLDLSSNMLADISGDSFANLLTLQRLNLAGNGISRPPWEALNGLSSLQYLYLQDNNITELQKSAFGNLPTLFVLDLSRNGLTTVARQAFNGLQQLLNLSLSDNLLEKIPNEAFKTLVALRRVDLSHNQLEKIDNKTNGLLDDCLSLEMVDLSYNNIGFLTKKMFPSSPWIPYRLQEIDLSHNSIPVLTYDLTFGTKTVKKMNFSGNPINEIRNHVLGNLTSLEILDLSNNDLDSLQARSSDVKFKLPENISTIYLQSNKLQSLPVESIINATKLKYLDVRNNALTAFEPSIVKKILHKGLEFYYEGNNLYCNCYVRPLKHYLNRLSNSYLQTDTKYKNINCTEPLHLANENIFTLNEDRLLCNDNTEEEKNSNVNSDEDVTVKVKKDEGLDEFDLIAEPDLAFRDVQYSQTTIYVHWFVLTTEDVADFVIYIRDGKNNIPYTQEVSYSLRSLTFSVDENLKKEIQNGVDLDICVTGKTSNGAPRKWHKSQCRQMEKDFEYWPKKLNVDKRRLTKKRVKYSWFSSNSVLGLVSDSILITLCIFLGVCLKMTDRLTD